MSPVRLEQATPQSKVKQALSHCQSNCAPHYFHYNLLLYQQTWTIGFCFIFQSLLDVLNVLV